VTSGLSRSRVDDKTRKAARDSARIIRYDHRLFVSLRSPVRARIESASERIRTRIGLPFRVIRARDWNVRDKFMRLGASKI